MIMPIYTVAKSSITIIAVLDLGEQLVEKNLSFLLCKIFHQTCCVTQKRGKNLGHNT